MLKELIVLDFIRRAFIGGVLVSLCASILGVSLVLKRYSMIGDGLSHVGFGGLAIGTLLGITPMYVAMPVVILCAFLLLRIKDGSKIKGDAAIALISTASLSIGVIAISYSSGANTDVYNYLFGSVLSMTKNDVIMIFVLSLAVIVTYIFSYNKIFSITFDERFAKVTGINSEFYDMLIALLSAVTIVIGMKMIGAMLISSLIIFPPLTAMRVCKTFKSVTVTSVIISVLCFSAGLFISMIVNSPTGATIVLVNVFLFVIFSLYNKIMTE